MISQRLDEAIRNVPDFPKLGINFKDITPILLDPQLTRDIVDEMVNHVKALQLDAIVGIESRGFWFGIMLANKLDIPFIPIRKKGKLPYKTVSYAYDLEYGSAEIEMHKGEIKKGWNVLIHDDLLATGGTACAAAELIKMQDANVAGFSFVVDLTFLNGSDILKKYSENIFNLVSY
ncbi:MAG: adenine phosphoribosyltransferase [Vicingaceae bacterium]